MINQITKNRIAALFDEYKKLSTSKAQATREISIAEIPEMVYNSNAIEKWMIAADFREE